MTLREIQIRDASENGEVKTHIPGQLSLFLLGKHDFARGDRVLLLAWNAPEVEKLKILKLSNNSIVERGTTLWSKLDRLRHRLRSLLRKNLSEANSAWLCAILLGDRCFLGKGLKDSFRRIGQSHLLAISGLHVGLLLALLNLVLCRFQFIPLRVKSCLRLCFLLSYCGLAGGDAPVLRAMLFGLLAELAIFSNRPIKLFQCLCFALPLVLIAHGENSDQPSFLFSFAALFGIALCQSRLQQLPLWRTKKSKLKKLKENLLISSSAWAGVSVVLVHFSPFTVLWAPLLSLIFIPLLSLLLLLGFTRLLLIQYSGKAIGYLDSLLEQICQVMQMAAELADQLPGTPLLLPALPAAFWSVFVLLLFARLLGPPFSKACNPLLVICIILAIFWPSSEIGGKLLSVGRGQCFILWDKNSTLVYDLGSMELANGGSSQLLYELWKIGRSNIDLLILSHPHADHINGVQNVMDCIQVVEVWIGPRFNRMAAGQLLINELQAKKIHLKKMIQGDAARLSDWKLQVLHPSATRTPWRPTRINDDSLCIKVTGNQLKLLLMGDLQQAGLISCSSEQFNELQKADIILMPHHARFDHFLRDFLALCSPSAAIAATPRKLALRSRRVLESLSLPTYYTTREEAVDLIWQPTDSKAPWRIRGNSICVEPSLHKK